MPKVLALAAENTKAVFHKRYVDIREVGNSDVSIKVQYCGVCHSDLHQVRGEWPIPTLYPMVPGHEIVGVVDAVGPNVTKYKVGDRVGVGCMVDSCRDCEECKQGIEQYCDNGNTPTYNGKWADGSLTFGGYSERMVVDEHFVLRIPDNMDLAKAGPLLCAGITTYSPLVHFGALKAGSDFHVGVHGFGGLGHMAVKLAKAMGNQVTVISRGEKKRANAEELGANFVNSEDAAQVKSVRKAFNLIISTVAGKFNGWNSVMGMLKTNGVLALVGLPPTAIELEPFSVVGGRKSFAGSGIGGIKETQEMLDFCAAHDISPEVTIVDVKEINKVHASLFEGQGDVFRFVLDIAETLKDGEWDVEVDKRTAEQTWTVRGNVEPADRNVHAAAARAE